MSTLRFRVRAKDQNALLDAIADEVVRFSGSPPRRVEFDASPVYAEAHGGERRLLDYVADVVVEFP